MRKMKDALSLFEVMGKKADEPPASEDDSQEPQREVEPPAPVKEPEIEKPQRLISIREDRVHFSLSTLHMALVLFAIGLLMLTSFLLGRRSGMRWQSSNRSDRLEARVPDGLSEARNQLPDPGVLEDLNKVQAKVREQAARQRQAQRSPTNERLVGLNYIWIEVVDHHDDAVNARNYLEAEGVPSTIYALTSSKKWALITTIGFDYDIPESRAACEDLQAKIRDIGRQYAAAHGRYGFQHCYAKKKKADDKW